MIRRVVISVLIFAALVSCGGPRLIPKQKMAEIYADMFVADQWIRMENSRRRAADTSLVYEPIFRKYGYTTDDYIHSLDHYMSDPESFEKVFLKSVSILQAVVDSLTYDERLQSRLDSLHKAFAARIYPKTVTFDDLSKVPMGRGFVIGRDTCDRIILLPSDDTVFRGPVILEKDSVWFWSGVMIDSLRRPSYASLGDSAYRRPQVDWTEANLDIVGLYHNEGNGLRTGADKKSSQSGNAGKQNIRAVNTLGKDVLKHKSVPLSNRLDVKPNPVLAGKQVEREEIKQNVNEEIRR